MGRAEDAVAARVAALVGERRTVVLSCPAAAGVAAALARAAIRVADHEPARAGVIVLLGTPADPAYRQRLVADTLRRLPASAPVVVVDHSQPRRTWPRLRAFAALLARGLPPSRGRYPAARELQALGLQVDRLELATAEAVQLILAHRPWPA
jgi:hypothetical protein